MNSLPHLIASHSHWPGSPGSQPACSVFTGQDLVYWYIKPDNTVTQLYSPTIHITGHNGKHKIKGLKYKFKVKLSKRTFEIHTMILQKIHEIIIIDVSCFPQEAVRLLFFFFIPRKQSVCWWQQPSSAALSADLSLSSSHRHRLLSHVEKKESKSSL